MALTLGKKISLGFCVAVAALAVVITVGQMGIRRLAAFHDESLARSQSVAVWATAANGSDRFFRIIADVVLTRDMEICQASWSKLKAELQRQLTEDGDRDIDARLRERLASATQAFDGVSTSFETEFLPLLQIGSELADIAVVHKSLEAKARTFSSELGLVVEAFAEESRIANARFQAQQRQITAWTLTSGTCALILTGLALWWNVAGARHELHTRVGQLLGNVSAAAQGDLTTRVEVRGEDASGRMGAALDQLLGTLRRSIGEIAAANGELGKATGELGAVAGGLTDGAQQTARQATTVSCTADGITKSLLTVASGIEELVSSINEIAHNAQQASQVAGKAVVSAQSSSGAATKLSASSAAIGEVLKVISDIAEQTNLLALNATIEAARAGDAGRGNAPRRRPTSVPASPPSRPTARRSA